MSYSPKAIANTFLEIAASHGDSICPMRMQKLVYFAHGWYSSFKNEPLISEEVLAWTYGPVIESLYHEFKKYGSKPISEPVLDVEINRAELLKIKVIKPKIDDSDSYTKALLNKIWEVYGKYSAVELSNLTHQTDSPWYNAKLAKKSAISEEEIREYFKKQRKEAN